MHTPGPWFTEALSTAAEAGYFVRAEAAADLAFRVRCALAKETLED